MSGAATLATPVEAEDVADVARGEASAEGAGVEAATRYLVREGTDVKVVVVGGTVVAPISPAALQGIPSLQGQVEEAYHSPVLEAKRWLRNQKMRVIVMLWQRQKP